MQTSKKLFKPGIFLILLAGILSLSSCGDNSPIQIGYVGGLTGRYSQLAIGVRNGVTLAVDTLNKNGGVNGRQIELVVRDDKSDPAEGEKIFTELIEMKIPVVIGPLLSKMAATTLRAIKEQNVLVISPTVSTDAILNMDDNFLRVIPESSFQAEIISAAITGTDIKSVAIVYDLANKAYTEPIYDVFKKRMTEAGVEIAYVNTLKNAKIKYFSVIADEIVDAAPDALFLVTSSIDGGELCQQVRKKDNAIIFYGSHWVKSGNIIEIGGRSVDGMFFASHYESNEKSDLYKEFHTKFINAFKSTPNFPSVYGYEAVMAMADGMGDSKSYDPERIKAAILAKGKFQGLEEIFKINQYGDAERSRSLVQIENGDFVRVDL